MARRILLFVTDLEIGGTPTVVRELALRLHQPPEVEIEVACLKRLGPVGEEIRSHGISVTAFDVASPLQIFSAVSELRRIVREREIDTVFSFLMHANTVAAIASRRLHGVRFLQSIQTTQSKPRWHWWIQAMAHHAAETVVVPSSAVMEAAIERSHVPVEKLCVIPNAIDPASFPLVDVFTEPDKVPIGYLGRLDPVKNVPSWVQGVASVQQDQIRIEGHIFGEGSERGKIEREIQALNVGDRVFLHGAVSDPRIAFQQMDVLCLMSDGEGFGLVLIEAMASGVPVIALNLGGVRDIIINGENGLAIESESLAHRRMSQHISELIRDPQLRQRIIDGGLRTVREKFSWDTVLPQYQQLLRIG